MVVLVAALLKPPTRATTNSAGCVVAGVAFDVQVDAVARSGWTTDWSSTAPGSPDTSYTSTHGSSAVDRFTTSDVCPLAQAGLDQTHAVMKLLLVCATRCAKPVPLPPRVTPVTSASLTAVETQTTRRFPAPVGERVTMQEVALTAVFLACWTRATTVQRPRPSLPRSEE